MEFLKEVLVSLGDEAVFFGAREFFDASFFFGGEGAVWGLVYVDKGEGGSATGVFGACAVAVLL